jgi:membrane protein
MASAKNSTATIAHPSLNAKTIFAMLKQSAAAWSDDKASRLAAALSYYPIFSIAPLLIIAIAVVGLVFGQEAASNQVFQQIRGLVGDEGAKAIQTMVQSAHKSDGGIWATVIGVGTILLGASGAFGQLQDALNTIWQVKPKSGQGIKGFVRIRVISFSLVLVIGFMLLVTLVLSALMAGLGSYLEGILPIPSVALQALNFFISFSVTALLFTLIYKVLPDVTVKWKDVWIGGVVTALLFSLGRFLIGLYLGKGSVGSAYGAAGSLVIILLWIYYSSQILFFGAEFTKVFANTLGSHIKPSPHAEPVSEGARLNQGMEAKSTGSPVKAKALDKKALEKHASDKPSTPASEATSEAEVAPPVLHHSGKIKPTEPAKKVFLSVFAGTLGALAFRHWRKAKAA